MRVSLKGQKQLQKPVGEFIADMALASNDNRIQYIFENEGNPYFAIVMLRGTEEVNKLTALEDEHLSVDIIESLAEKLITLAADTGTTLSPEIHRLLDVAEMHTSLKREDSLAMNPALIEDAQAVLQQGDCV